MAHTGRKLTREMPFRTGQFECLGDWAVRQEFQGLSVFYLLIVAGVAPGVRLGKDMFPVGGRVGGKAPRTASACAGRGGRTTPPQARHAAPALFAPSDPAAAPRWPRREPTRLPAGPCEGMSAPCCRGRTRAQTICPHDTGDRG